MHVHVRIHDNSASSLIDNFPVDRRVMIEVFLRDLETAGGSLEAAAAARDRRLEDDIAMVKEIGALIAEIDLQRNRGVAFHRARENYTEKKKKKGGCDSLRCARSQ